MAEQKTRRGLLDPVVDAYNSYIGRPFASVAGGAINGYLGFDRPSFANEQVYRTAQALSGMPGVGAPAGIFKAVANAPEALAALGGLLGRVGVGKLAGDTGEGMTAAEKAWATRMEKVARNKGVQHREALRQGDTVVENVIPVQQRTIISPEDLYGKVGVQVQGDRSRTGDMIRSLRGVPVDGGVMLEGGPMYSALADQMGTGGAWASMRGAAAGKQKQFDRAAEMTGRDPVGVYSAMGLQGVNFATPVAEAMIKQLRVLSPSKAAIASANKEIQKKAPEFVGLLSPDALPQVLGKDGFPMEGAGQVRKQVVETLMKPGYEYLGFPVYDDIIDAATQPELKNVPLGASGFTVFQAKPNAGLIEKSDVKMPHGSYDTVIPGKYMGGLLDPIPADVMFPRTYERQRAMGRNPQQIHRSLQVNNQDFEVFDQQWLDGVMNYLRSAER